MRAFVKDYTWLSRCVARLDGVDISADCAGVDEEAGIAYCLVKTGPNSYAQDDAGDPLLVERRGVVEVFVNESYEPQTQAMIQRALDLERQRQRDQALPVSA